MSARRPPVRLARGAREVATVFAIAVATIAGLEGMGSLYLLVSDLRSIRPPARLSRPHAVADSLLGWRNAARFTDLNAYGKGIALNTTQEGFRATPSSGTPPSSTIVCSGDSYTFGMGVADDRHWCARLSRLSPGVRTVDMAQDTYGLDQIYLWYRRDGQSIPATAHVIGLTNTALERATSPDPGGWLKPSFELDGERLELRDVPVPAQTWSPLRRARIGRALGELRLVELFQRSDRFEPASRREARVDANRPLVEGLLGAIADVDRQRARHLVVAYLPGPRDVSPGPLDARRAWLADVARRRGITLVDLTPALRRLPRDSADLAFISRLSPVIKPEAAGQYSNLGHDWVARELAPHLTPFAGADVRTGSR